MTSLTITILKSPKVTENVCTVKAEKVIVSVFCVKLCLFLHRHVVYSPLPSISSHILYWKSTIHILLIFSQLPLILWAKMTTVIFGFYQLLLINVTR